MNRNYFEILTLLSGGNHYQIGNMYQTFHAYTGHDFNTFKHALYNVVAYGLVERLTLNYPLFCNQTFLKITDKGLRFLDEYEIKFYKGTKEASFIDSEFLGI